MGVVVLALGIALILQSEGVPAPLAKGQPPPGFALPNLEGNAVISLDRLSGKVVLVNFWATWCKPCEDEMPAMERLYRELAPEGFELLALSVDADIEQIAAFRDQLGITFPILLDTNQDVYELYQTSGLPESLLVDRDGNLVERYVGPREWDDRLYIERIRSLLGGAAPR